MRRAVVLLASLGVFPGAVGVAAAPVARQFPASVYPAPDKARAGGALSVCPSADGLERFSATATRAALRIAGGYGRISLAHDLRNSDRGWWPQVRDTWRSGRPSREAMNRVVHGSAEPLARDGYSVIVGFSCGNSLVEKSLVVAVGPRQRRPPYCDACASTVFFIDRRGRTLVYYLY